MPAVQEQVFGNLKLASGLQQTATAEFTQDEWATGLNQPTIKLHVNSGLLSGGQPNDVFRNQVAAVDDKVEMSVRCQTEIGCVSALTKGEHATGEVQSAVTGYLCVLHCQRTIGQDGQARVAARFTEL